VARSRSLQELEIADLIRRRDKDGDDHVSLAEYVAGEREEHAAQNGPVDEEDAEEAADFLEEGEGEEADDEQEPVTEAELKQEFESLDSDKDGKLSFKEMMGLLQLEEGHWKDDLEALFDDVDVNGDRHISAEELQKARHSLLESPLVQEWADLGAFVEEGEEAEEEDSDREEEEDEEEEGEDEEEEGHEQEDEGEGEEEDEVHEHNVEHDHAHQLNEEMK